MFCELFGASFAAVDPLMATPDELLDQNRQKQLILIKLV